PGPGTADALGVGQRERDRVAGRVLLDGDEDRYPLAVDELAAYQVPGPLRGDHRHVHIGRWGDQPVPDVQPVPEEQRLAGGEVRLDVVRVDVPLRGVRGEQHDDVGPGAHLGRGTHGKALLLRLDPAPGALRQADPHVDPGVPQRQRVRVALAAVTDDGDLLPGDDRQVGIVVVVDLSG